MTKNEILYMTEEKHIEQLWKILNSINSEIKIAESKAMTIISTSSIVTAFLFSKSGILDILSNSIVYNILFILCSSLLLFSITFALFAVRPNFKNKSESSILFFDSILSKYCDGNKYHESFKNIVENNDNAFEKQLSEQIVVKSIIAKNKFKSVTIAINFFAMFLLLLMLLVLVS